MFNKIALFILLFIPVAIFAKSRKKTTPGSSSGGSGNNTVPNSNGNGTMTINNANLSFNSPLLPLGTPNRITLHHTAGENDTIQSIHALHLSKGWAGVGYHFVVYQNGEIWQGRPVDKLGAHSENNNTSNIGVCFVGNFENHGMNATQLQAGINLVNWIKSTQNVNTVTFHKNLKSTACPGANFPYTAFQ